MEKAKKLITAALMVTLLGSLAGCIVVDRGRGYSSRDGYCRDRYCR
jgi:hypothetical protein